MMASFLLGRATMTKLSLCLGLGASIVVLLAAACGGSTDDGLNGGGGSAGSGAQAGSSSGGSSGNGGVGAAAGSAGVAGIGGGAAGGAGAGGTGGGTSYTLDNVCSKVAPQICSAAESCCNTAGFGYDANGCQAASIFQCGKDVAEVKAGTMTFDPSKIDACLAEYQKLLAKCVLSIADFFSLLEGLAPCNSIFQGNLPEGAACQRDAQCALPGTPNTYVGCDEGTKTCVHWTRLAEGAQCQLGDGVTDYCETGLYCDVNLVGSPPFNGTCKQATALGAKCDGTNPYNLECGLGYYCNASTSLCTVAKVGGASCTTGIECQTFDCEAGKCTAQEPLVDQGLCTGG